MLHYVLAFLNTLSAPKMLTEREKLTFYETIKKSDVDGNNENGR